MIKYIILIGYIVMTIGIGLKSKSGVESTDNFFLGDRNLGGWVSAFAYATTLFSAVIFINAGVLGWNGGISTIWFGVAGIVSCVVPWVFYAKKTREVTEELDITTMPEFFEKKFNSKNLKIISSIVIFIFMIPYGASVYQGIGYMFESTFGISYIYCLVLIAVLTAIYLVLGGYVATAINSLIQGVIIFIGSICIFAFGFSDPALGGGIGTAIGKLSSLPDVGAEMMNLFGSNPVKLISFCIVLGIGPVGLPQMIHKFYGIKKEEVKKATWVTIIFGATVSLGIHLLGSFSRLYYNYYGWAEPSEMGHIIPTILEHILPGPIYALIVVLLLAAAMSTLSSLALVASSSVVLDLFTALGIKYDDKKTLRIMRYFCLSFIIISLILGLSSSSIVSLMSYSWGTIAGVFFAPFTYGLFYKKANRKSTIASVAVSLTISIYGILFLDSSMASLIGAIAIIVPIIVYPIVAMVTYTGDSEIKN